MTLAADISSLTSTIQGNRGMEYMDWEKCCSCPGSGGADVGAAKLRIMLWKRLALTLHHGLSLCASDLSTAPASVQSIPPAFAQPSASQKCYVVSPRVPAG